MSGSGAVYYTPLKGKAPALTADSDIYKDTKLAYYDVEFTTTVKKFKVQAPGSLIGA
jgi:hypothetical protein